MPGSKKPAWEPTGTMDSMGGTVRHTQFQILVAARLRPFNKKELKEHHEAKTEPQPVLDVERDGKHCTLLDPTKSFAERANFSFDHIFSAFRPTVELQPVDLDSDDDDDELQAERAQAEIYKALGEPIVDSAWQGYNGCIFAYGQTSSGKTYTMMGTKRDPGIIPRLCRTLFEKIEEVELTQAEELLALQPPIGDRPSSSSYGAMPDAAATATSSPSSGVAARRSRKIIRCEVSYMEIYNERVRDLLKSKKREKPKFNTRFDTSAANDEFENLRVRQHPIHGPFVEGITKVQVNSWLECVKLIRTGNDERSSATTEMNDSSSRSHAIFQMVLTQTEALGAKVRGKEVVNHKVSKINLVDLAGSERITRTNVTGIHVTEANYINKSLATLRKVIDVLVLKMGSGSGSGSGSAAASMVIPYRESLLTWILSDNFGGNSKTVMMANVSPHQSNFLETESTLRYATLAKGIINRVRVNEDPSAKLIRELQAQLKALQTEMGSGPQQQRVRELEEQMEENKRAMEELLLREEGMRQLIQESRSREEKLRHEKEDLERAQDHWRNEAEKLRREKEALRDQLRRVAEGGKLDRELLLSNNKGNFWMEGESGGESGAAPPARAAADGSVPVSGAGDAGGGAATPVLSPVDTSCPSEENSRIRRASLASARRKAPGWGGGEDAKGDGGSARAEGASGGGAAASSDDRSRAGAELGGSISPPPDAPRFGRRAATEEGKERDRTAAAFGGALTPTATPSSNSSGAPPAGATVRTAEARAGRRRDGAPDALGALSRATSSPLPPQPSTVPLSLQHLAGPSAGVRESASPKVPQLPDALDSFLSGGAGAGPAAAPGGGGGGGGGGGPVGGGEAFKKSAVPPWRQRK